MGGVRVCAGGGGERRHGSRASYDLGLCSGFASGKYGTENRATLGCVDDGLVARTRGLNRARSWRVRRNRKNGKTGHHQQLSRATERMKHRIHE